VDALYASTVPAPAAPAPGASGSPAAAPTAAEKESRLVDAIALRPEELPALLSARQAAAREALEAAGVDAARLFPVQGGARAQQEPGPRVIFTVR
jgi:hypothetical protein